jgi:two-component system OmpR family sensor kinase
MSDIGSKLRSHWVELLWGAFAAANLTVILLLDQWETVPFHFIWVSLTILYGFRVWSIRTTAAVLAAVILGTGLALLVPISHGHERVDELSEVPLMAAMFVAMVWHARRRQAATEESRRLAESEHRLLERERAFVHDASHELRTPITIARGHAELIRSAHAGSETAEDAEIVIDELGRLASISERLLILAAADQPDFLQKAAVGVRDLVEAVARRWTVTAQRRWAVEVGAEGTVPVDRARVEAALDALVENAVKFTAGDDAISIRARTSGGEVVVEVADSGEGIPADHLDRIFERFARVDRGRSRESGGTGLGLAIVRAVAEAHGGMVEVESEAGAGSLFRLRLPGFVGDEIPPRRAGHSLAAEREEVPLQS